MAKLCPRCFVMYVVMKYHVEERDGIRFVGLKFFVSLDEGAASGTVPSFWESLPKETYDELKSLSDCYPDGVVGVFGEKHDNGFDFWITAATTKPCPEHFDVVEVPPAKWLVFEGRGPLPGSVQEIFAKVYMEFFPNSAKYSRRWEVYEIEWFSDGDPTAEDYLCKGWVPIVEK